MNLDSPAALWDRVVDEFVKPSTNGSALSDFFRLGVDRVGLVKQALLMPGGNSRAAAIGLLQRMRCEEQQQLFPELIQLARAAHGPVGTVREIISSLPREWVLRNIDAAVGQALDQNVYDDYWMFLELYAVLDRERAATLARRAAAHRDPDIQELGLDWLSRFSAERPGSC